MAGIDLGADLSALIRDMREIPGDTGREMGKTMKRSAKSILQDAKARASWSSRIPGALSTRVTGKSASSPGVDLVGKTGRAPHMRPYEGWTKGGKQASFRHPLFGNRNYWYSQPARPFITPAISKGVKQFRKDVADAAVSAYKKAGFK